MLMPKLFKHVNCPTNVISAFDKPCIPLKTSMKILFMSRNGHDKNVWEWSHVLGKGMGAAPGVIHTVGKINGGER
jgi:hypothetical protein